MKAFLIETLPYLAVYLILINLIAFIAYGADKRNAKKKQWRTPEATLLLLALLGGSLGAFAGMQVFRHKTNHLKFTLGVPLILIVHLGIAALFYMMYR